jgi:hypothetical protein
MNTSDLHARLPFLLSHITIETGTRIRNFIYFALKELKIEIIFRNQVNATLGPISQAHPERGDRSINCDGHGYCLESDHLKR